MPPRVEQIRMVVWGSALWAGVWSFTWATGELAEVKWGELWKSLSERALELKTNFIAVFGLSLMLIALMASLGIAIKIIHDVWTESP